MTLAINLIPTADGSKRAQEYSTTGFKVDAKYIGVGSGRQTITIDDDGYAVQDTLKKHFVWMDILGSRRVTDYQDQMFIDLAGVSEEEFPVTEIILADENKQAIAIYGHQEKTIMTVTPAMNKALIAINLVLGTFPAGSVNIIHQGLDIELFNANDVAGFCLSILKSTVSDMKQIIARDKEQQLSVEREVAQEEKIAAQGSQIEMLMEQMTKVFASLSDQQKFNVGLSGQILKNTVLDMKQLTIPQRL